MKTSNVLFTMMVMVFFTISLNAQTISDTDNDTRVETERTPDDDLIRFRLGGTDSWRMINKRIEPVSSGNSVFIGFNAGASDNLTNNSNVFVGNDAGANTVNGASNVALGRNALNANIGGSGNFGLGNSALRNSSAGNSNVAIGTNSMVSQTSGSSNVGIGGGTNFNNLTGSNNVMIGTNAGNGGVPHSKSGNIFIGFRAGFNELGSDKLYIANSDDASPLLYGDFVSEYANINGELAVNNSGSGNFNPSAPLHVKTAGSEMARFESTAGSKWLSFYDGSTRNGILWNVGSTMVLRSDQGGVRFETNGFNNRMEIGSDGDIGVGVTAAGSRGKFHIQNASGVDDPELNLESTGTGFARLEFSNSGGDGYWHIAGDANGNPKMNFWYDEDGSGGPIVGENVMTIDGDQQRVGIGTSSPSNKLEINGATGGAGQFVSIDVTDDTGLNAGNDILEINAPSTAADGVNLIEAQRGGSIMFQVNANGQTSVGGNSLVPTGFLFAVDGKSAMEELLIEDSGSWPDYVFESDYQLKSLEEVEASINANGHLPGVPSATVVEAEGIKVGNMQKISMEKIEELTLYAIDANKKIKTLDKENTELKTTVEKLNKGNSELKTTVEELIKRIEQLEKK